MLSKTQVTSSCIRTHLADSISNDNGRYAKRASNQVWKVIFVFIIKQRSEETLRLYLFSV